MASGTGIENILRNRAGDELSAHERAVLEGAVYDTRTYPAGHTLVRQGQPVDISTLLVEGLMTRHIDARDGRRHMVGVYVPGDFVDLHAYALKRLDHDIGALTNVRVAIVPHAALERIQASMPHLTRRLWFLTLLDGALHRQWVYRLSSLDARERVAHFLCETNARLLAVGISDGSSFPLPVTQVDIGEVCSITNVHVNRVLRQLREAGLCTFRSSVVQIHDLKGLAAAGQFQPDYLYLNPPTALRAMGEPREHL
jgi:CRP-like cAMP-binding protein